MAMEHKLPKFIRRWLIGWFIAVIIGILITFAYARFLLYVFKHTSINDCIKQTKQNPDEIRELVCAPDSDAFPLSGKDYDLLGKLQNLESVTLSDIPGCSIKRLGDIENLSSLCIEKARYPIVDLELLGTYGNFKNLKTLKLYSIQLETLPDLSELGELESLAIHDLYLTRLEPDGVNWENLVSLDITGTRISSLDEEIVSRLCNLTILDISHSHIADVSFVLELPKLKGFSYRGHEDRGVDLECLRKHPNFNEDWLKN